MSEVRRTPRHLRDRGAMAFVPVLSVLAALVGCDDGGNGGEAPPPGGWPWGDVVTLGTGVGGDALRPRIATDGQGNAIVAFDLHTGSRYDAWASRYEEGTGWGTSEQIETDDTYGAGGPVVAMHAVGWAVAVWGQSDASRASMWANRYDVGTGWGTPELIEWNDTGGVTYPDLGMDAAGDAIAVWAQSDGTTYDAWANRYVPGSGWGTPELLESSAGDVEYPKIAVNPAGHAVAVWHQSDGTRNNIWANVYDPSAGWGTAELIETNDVGHAYSPRVALDTSGRAIAVWFQHDGTRNNIWHNRYLPASGWGTAAVIETDTANAAYPTVVALSDGSAMAAWQQDGVWAAPFDPLSGWGTRTKLSLPGTAWSVELASDSTGRVLAAWDQLSGTDGVHFATHDPATGWGQAELIQTEPATSRNPRVAVDSLDRPIVAWEQFNGSYYDVVVRRHE